MYIPASSEHVYQKKRLGEYFDGIEKKFNFWPILGHFGQMSSDFSEGEVRFLPKWGYLVIQGI